MKKQRQLLVSKTLLLTVADRIYLAQLLPQQGGKIKMMLVKSIADQIDFTPEEISRFGLKDEGKGLIRWNPAVAQTFEFMFTPEQVSILKEGVEEADRLERITRTMLGLIEKIDAL